MCKTVNKTVSKTADVFVIMYLWCLGKGSNETMKIIFCYKFILRKGKGGDQRSSWDEKIKINVINCRDSGSD